MEAVGLAFERLRSDKYYYVISGRLWFTVDGEVQELARGCFCLVARGRKFSRENRAGGAAVVTLFHVPGYDPASEVFTGRD